ncbi:BrnA antitoxin family protein [Devosia neptuniae]|uniref:BrnA antitoxin family protein n=1 Tax=Devosia neptuniae TaxID=191302 RepID=A0ABY6CL19_9HYPH|nr:BrnA antitoxin family protein [Devosia neptuniae]UXN71711.1 BrnA antitoxin family protein [Devosia neptuniae]
MTEANIKRISLEELIALDKAGALPKNNPDAQPGEDLPDEFWDNAVWVDYREPTSVHLKLDPLVFAWFKQQGKGHLTHMQNVLKAYVQAEMRKKKRGNRHPDAAE